MVKHNKYYAYSPSVKSLHWATLSFDSHGGGGGRKKDCEEAFLLTSRQRTIAGDFSVFSPSKFTPIEDMQKHFKGQPFK